MRIMEGFEHQGVKGFKFGYHPLFKPNLFVNIYYIDGLLIDTGQRHMQKVVLNSLQPLEIKQIYLTICRSLVGFIVLSEQLIALNVIQIDQRQGAVVFHLFQQLPGFISILDG